MRKFTTAEVNSLITITESSFNDICNISITSSGIQDSVGQEDYSYTVVSGINCGFHPTRSFKNYKGEIIVPEYDAELRLSLSQAISSRDLVTHSGVLYSVDGINVGRTCKVLSLKELDI